MARETGKQRSQRIQIDYYRRRGGLHLLRNLCIAAGLIGAGLYAAYVLASGGGSHTSTGPLAIAHASFENDCQKCHADFTPIDAQAAKLELPLAGISRTASIAHIESACQQCHAVGHHHRDKMTVDGKLMDQNCSLCHTEHQGRQNDLLAISSQQCTVCHANLSDVCSGQPTYRATVTQFTAADHGDFASLSQSDPGKVKFDHHQHLLPGQVDAGAKGQFTLAMLDQSLRDRYRHPGQADSDPAQLDCASCHQYAGNPDPRSSLATDSELGRYMAPISFEQHCAACHEMNPGVATADTTPLPHAVPWSKVDLLLAASLTGARVTGQARMPRDDTNATPQVGEGTGTAAPAESANPVVDVAAARQAVQQQCLKCHDQGAITDTAIADALAGKSPPLIPPRWFRRGLYDHAAHRKVDCRYCHQAAYPGDGPSGPPQDHETVMIAGIESCTDCHRAGDRATPTQLTGGEMVSMLGGQATWESDACMLCHRYHTSETKP